MRRGWFPPLGFVLTELGLGELVWAPFLALNALSWSVHLAVVTCTFLAKNGDHEKCATGLVQLPHRDGADFRVDFGGQTPYNPSKVGGFSENPLSRRRVKKMRHGRFPPFGFVLTELGLGELVWAPFWAFEVLNERRGQTRTFEVFSWMYVLVGGRVRFGPFLAWAI